MEFRRTPIAYISALLALTLFALVGNFQFTPAQAAYADITLGSAENYVLLAGSAITNGALTNFAGDGALTSGISPTPAAAGIGASLLVSGSTRFDDGGDTATAAQTDLGLAIDFAESLTITTAQAAISNETFTAGIYGTNSSVALAIGGVVTLDAGGDNRAIFIFRTGSALDFAAATSIVLVNGAQASNIYWVAGSALTIGASSVVFGNLIARSAMTIGASSVVTGSFLTQGAITLGASVATTHQLRIAFVAPTSSPTPSPSSSASASPTPTASASATPSPSASASATPSASASPTSTSFASATASPTPTSTPGAVQEPAPVIRATPTPYTVQFFTPAPGQIFPWSTPSVIQVQETPSQPIVPVPVIGLTPAPSIKPTVIGPKPTVLPIAPASPPVITVLPVDTITPEFPVPGIITKKRFLTRNDFATYDPINHPRNTANTAIAAFAILTVITSGATTSQGYLAQVARGGKLAAAIALGRGDRRRSRKSRVSGKSVNFFTALATGVSRMSPLASRTISDASYLRASFGMFSLATYPIALTIGTFAASSVHFQGLPPSISFVALMMGLGVVDAMAGFVAGITFALLIAAKGNVTDLKTGLTLAGILLLSYSPGILAGVFRPLRRIVNDSRSAWERAADYLLAAILSGWVVKQIASGLNGLSGLQLPIAEHANQLGLIASAFVIARFLVEDIVSKTFPSRINDLEPEYRDRNGFQKLMSTLMQVAVFMLVAQPFIGWRPELWIGLAIFALPIFLGLASSHLPKSKFIHRWLPIGVTEMLVMSVIGFALAILLKGHTSTPARYVLIAFVVLSVPGFIFDILRLFAGGYDSSWKESNAGNFLYRVLGSFGLIALIYIVTKGLLV